MCSPIGHEVGHELTFWYKFKSTAVLMCVTVRWTATDKGGEVRFRPCGYYAWHCNIGQVSILARHDSWEQIPVGLAGVQQRAYTIAR